MIKYFTSIVEEAKKVVWPTRTQVIKHTVLVISAVAVATAIFASVDLGLQEIVKTVVGSN